MISAAEKLDQEITLEVLAAMPGFREAFWEGIGADGAPVSPQQQMVEIWDALVNEDKDRLFDLISGQLFRYLIRCKMQTRLYDHLSEDEIYDNL